MSDNLSNPAPPRSAATAATTACPSCRRSFQHNQPGLTRCPWCRWTGQIFHFTPVPITIEHSEQAVGEDATCIHHPTKRATVICAGTGDYICPLCAIELDGKTYSAAYLQNVGKEKVTQVFDIYLERPDNYITMLLAVTFFLVLLAPITMSYSFYLFFKMRRLRKTNPRYAQLVGIGRTVTLLVLIILLSLWFIAVACAILLA